MQEILPGLWHWSTEHPDLGQPVSSYVVTAARLAIDPLLPEDGAAALERLGVDTVALTCRHHRRDAPALQARLGARVLVPEPGLHEFDGDDELDVTGYADGDRLGPGVTAHALGAIAPDDFALHIDQGDGALAFADGLVDMDGIGFVPDGLMDDPARVKARMRELVESLLALRFDAVLFAHGHPIPTGGRRALRDWLDHDASS